MYPAIYGTGDLVLGAPMFRGVVIDPVGGHRVIRISAPAVDHGRRYVAGLRVNGASRSASWLDASQGRLGSLDLSDWSLSRGGVPAPGPSVPLGTTGVTFTWPSAAPGTPDNWIPHGQRVDLPNQPASRVSFLGLATNGPAAGTAAVLYTDGTVQPVTVSFADWAAAPPAGNTAVVTLSGRDNANGTAGTGTFRVFATDPAALDTTKTVDAVLLPESTDKGIMHIFDVAVSPAG